MPESKSTPAHRACLKCGLQWVRLGSAKMGNIDNYLLQYANKRYQEGRGLMKSDLAKQLVSERYGRFAVAVLAHGATP